MFSPLPYVLGVALLTSTPQVTFPLALPAALAVPSRVALRLHWEVQSLVGNTRKREGLVAPGGGGTWFKMGSH